MKGQLEFIVIFAMIIIAIVVILVTSSNFVAQGDRPIVTGLEQEKKLIIDSVLNSIRDSAKRELREIYITGGFSESSGNTVKYGIKEIGIWKDCDTTEAPDIGNMLESGLEKRIKNLFKPNMEFFGKEVSFDLRNVDVSVNVQEIGVMINVRMPTTVEGSTVTQTYSFLLPSRLKGIIELGEKITKSNGNSDFFEKATINTILYSNPEERWLPTIDLRTGCGNTFFRTGNDIRKDIENLLEYTASHTVYNRDLLNLPENPFYLLGISDSDLEVSFIYPEGWNLGNNLNVRPSPPVFHPKPILSFSSTCIEIMDIRYSMRFPIIVNIKDDLLDQLFSFAVMVNIDENKPGCGFKKGTETSYQKKCVSESECTFNLRVRDSKGLPVSNAFVTFGECAVGETDSLGLLSSVVPCMIGDLTVRREGYVEYSRFMKAGDLSDHSVVMEEGGKEIPVYFYGVPMKPKGDYKGGGRYQDYEVDGQPRQIDFFDKDYFILVYMKPKSGENIMLYNIDKNGFRGSSTVVIKPDSYDVFGAVVLNGTSGKTVGYAEGSYLSVGGESRIYVYLPVVEDMPESMRSTEIDKMKAAFSDCGIKVVSPSEQGVSVPCG